MSTSRHPLLGIQLTDGDIRATYQGTGSYFKTVKGIVVNGSIQYPAQVLPLVPDVTDYVGATVMVRQFQVEKHTVAHADGYANLDELELAAIADIKSNSYRSSNSASPSEFGSAAILVYTNCLVGMGLTVLSHPKTLQAYITRNPGHPSNIGPMGSFGSWTLAAEDFTVRTEGMSFWTKDTLPKDEFFVVYKGRNEIDAGYFALGHESAPCLALANHVTAKAHDYAYVVPLN